MNDHQTALGNHLDTELASIQIFEDFQDCPEVLDEVDALFRDTYLQDVQSIASAITTRDSSSLAFRAHKIKGSVMCFHHERAARAAALLEQMALDGDLEGSQDLVEVLNLAFGEVCLSMNRAHSMFINSVAQ